jgi:hypothetical protein
LPALGRENIPKGDFKFPLLEKGRGGRIFD